MHTLFLAHLVTTFQSDSLPVVGSPVSSLVFALLFTLVILIAYLIVDHLPKPKKNKITNKTEPTFAKVAIVLVCSAMLSSAWDIWWHRAVGRDSFFVPPHIFLYSFAILAIGTCFYVWRHCRDPLWKHLSFVLIFILISAPFDNFWHTLNGVENYSKPTQLAWAPPHLLLALSVLTALVILVRILLKFRRTPDFSFFGNLSFGAIFSICLVLLLPFHPTEGWGQVAGFAGAGVIAATFIILLLTTERTMEGRIDATFATMLSMIFVLTSYGKETAPQIQVIPADRPPIWLLIFSFLVTAVLLDLTKNRFPSWLRGLFAGLVWAGILFGFSTKFFEPQFQYGLIETFVAISFSAMGGLMAGSIFGLFHLDDEKHIEKLLKKW